ncbi:10237_t:CDS:10, partial [Acaulospora colombiana]
IRLKRLARLAGSANNADNSSSTPSVSQEAGPSSAAQSPTPTSASNKPSNEPVPRSTEKSRLLANANITSQPLVPKPASRITISSKPSTPVADSSTHKPKATFSPFVFEKWEAETVETVFGVALDKDIAEKVKLVWLKGLAEEIIGETPGVAKPLRAKGDIADQLLIGRLELDPNSMSDDQEQLAVLASIPASQTSFEYLVGCWKRLNSQKASLSRKGLQPKELERANALLEKLRELVISYAGFTLQDPSMFPQPSNGKPLGAAELLPSLYGLGSAPSIYSVASESATLLNPTGELESFLLDLVKRFDKDGLEDVLGDVVRRIVFSPNLAVGMVHTASTIPLGLTPSSWRSSVAALECLFGIKPIAAMITRLPEWNPELWSETNPAGAKNGNEHEKRSILGMVMRLGVFARDWPPTRLSAQLSSAFGVVRAGPESREAFLSFVARVVQLNRKRAAIRVKYEEQACDSFIHNLNYVLLRLAEPFMDAQYKQMEKIDLRYYERSKRISLQGLTRINATPPEIEDWEKGADAPGPSPNFVSDVFYLLSAVNHIGTGPMSNYLSDMGRHVRDIKKQLEMMEKDESWRGGPMQNQIETAIKQGKERVSKIYADMESMYVALLQEEFASRSVSFANFVSVWLLRLVDPAKRHPRETIKLPLPDEVPLVFKVQPEYMFDDVVEFWDFMIKYKPTMFEYTGQKEIIDFAISFLTSTWYITNPYLKSKLVTPPTQLKVLDDGNVSDSAPQSARKLGLTHSSMINSITKANTKSYRRDIAEVMQSVWRDPTHRGVMENFTSNLQEFIKFANRLMNDVTFMLDELLSKLAEIKKLQLEMEKKEEWEALTQEQREDVLSKLRAAESIVEPWTIYSREFLSLLIEFTGSTKAPFVSSEIVDRLAAMLNYVLEQLAGKRSSNLKTKDLSKYG